MFPIFSLRDCVGLGLSNKGRRPRHCTQLCKGELLVRSILIIGSGLPQRICDVSVLCFEGTVESGFSNGGLSII